LKTVRCFEVSPRMVSRYIVDPFIHTEDALSMYPCKCIMVIKISVGRFLRFC